MAILCNKGNPCATNPAKIAALFGTGEGAENKGERNGDESLTPRDSAFVPTRSSGPGNDLRHIVNLTARKRRISDLQRKS